MKRCKQGVWGMTLLIALSSGAWSLPTYPCHGEVLTQPDGTMIHYSQCEFVITVDSFIVVQGSDGWYYYAELDARGEYEASPYKVGIDDPPFYNLITFITLPQRSKNALGER